MGGMTTRCPRRRNLKDSITIIGAIVGLYWFASSFFLAKKSLSHFSSCHESETLLTDILGMTQEQVKRLQDHGSLSRSQETKRSGCWMPRRVDSVMLLVVDALRFDFCLYNLPQSVGSRLSQPLHHSNQTTTRLLRFVADPPTVTMQRLKALTTGGLPTFADISANFGGANLEEDTWVHQLRKDSHVSRGLPNPTRTAFVGDDTWLDLFPAAFSESYPYPSFNTRDLDTVDNGCIHHLPNLTKQFLDQELEVVVIHFLGVDHVGHTYGPHNEHMDAKLKQIDAVLADTLDRMDRSSSCQAALILGDHGMTEDGNHGGGTEEEVSAALFVHVSPGCGGMTDAGSLEREADASLLWSASQTFTSIHQIDLVSTLSMMLGLPIPYANLGSMVPSLIPGYGCLDVATSLALNAAQVWRYLTVYSMTANKLPIETLKNQLQVATSMFRVVIDELEYHDSLDADKCHQASGLLKLFLVDALALGQRVWTRFDTTGMVAGILVLSTSFIVYLCPAIRDGFDGGQVYTWEMVLSCLALLFLCCLLTFSNSYANKEQQAIMFFLSMISLALAARIKNDPKATTLWRGILLIPVASRINELLVSGHGLDPSLQVHSAHWPPIFVLSMILLVCMRWYLLRSGVTDARHHCLSDALCMAFLTISWLEKCSPDPASTGFTMCRLALTILLLGIPTALYQALTTDVARDHGKQLSYAVTLLFKLALALAAVTGPSTASSLVLCAIQASSIYTLSHLSGSLRIQSVVVVALCRLVTRHMFFATNHGCAFNRLQYSSAFIATNEFQFVLGGISLFLNTFGWEIAGLALVWILSKTDGRAGLWRLYTSAQLLEALSSCLSVAILRRHLMVWDVFAPHFLFVSVFTLLNALWCLSATLLSV